MPASPGITPEQSAIIAETTRLLHAEKIRESAQFMSDSLRLGLKIESDSPAKCYPPLQYFFHWLMDSGARTEAAGLLWPKALFNPEPQSCRDVWKLYDEATLGLIMGAGSMSKSFSMGVGLFLDWVHDPEWTTIKVVGPSEDHLQANLFSHLVSLKEKSRLPLPGEVGDLFIGLNRRNLVSAIKGVIIPIGKVKKAGRLQGVKRYPRGAPHPVHGNLSRLRIFIDEIENVPGGLWSDLDNVLSNFSNADKHGLKIFGAYNPTNQYDEVGKRAEPVFGWGDFDADTHFRWESKRGWQVLRLDGERSENVIAGRVIFPGLQTKEGLEQIAKNSGGKDSPGYFAMGRGAYPPAGASMTVFSPGLLAKMRGEPVWFDAPKMVAGIDLALEGGAAAVFTLGRLGNASGIKLPASLEHLNGHTRMFKNSLGQVLPRPVLFAEQQFVLPKGDTVAMTEQIITICRKAAVRPEFVCVDRTGHGQGVADLLRHEWGEVLAVNYSEGATDLRIMAEDKETAKGSFDRVCSELWFATRSWAEFGALWIAPALAAEALVGQLTQRKFRTAGKKSRVESKADFKARGHSSPDEADSLTLLVHAARVRGAIVPSMSGDAPSSRDDFDDWGGSGSRIDCTNRPDTLEQG